jgi:hypothetical protein
MGDGNLHNHEFSHMDQVSEESAALFLFGSKVEHSCCPNVAYSSKTSDGLMEYKVIHPIKAGENVSFSYILDVFTSPTHERRQKLLLQKDFVCMCDRCKGPDFSRVAQCHVCGEFTPSHP